MIFQIKPLEEAQSGEVQTLLRTAAPERLGGVQIWLNQRLHGSEEGVGSEFMVAATQEGLLGYGGVWSQGKGRCRLDVVVAECCRRRGIGSALLDRLLRQVRGQKDMLVQARARHDRADALTFLARRGFEETNRMVHLRLEVAEARPAALGSLSEKLGAQGIEIVTLADEQRRFEDSDERLVELIQAAFPGRPDPYSRVIPLSQPCGLEAAQVLKSYEPLSLEAFFVAQCGRSYVGLSFLRRDKEGRVAYGDTAVREDYRGRGIATALKLRSLRFAAEQGYPIILASTANPVMRALNEKLRFRFQWADVRMVKKSKEL